MGNQISIIELDNNASQVRFEECAAIHIEQITGGFLSTLGPKVLARVYWSIAASPNAFILAGLSDGHIVGFICGCYDTRKLYQDVIRDNAFAFAIAGLRRFLSPNTLRKIWETLAYPSKKQPQGIPQEEILNFCVSPRIQRSGLGSNLMKTLCQKFRGNNVTAIRIVTGADQKSAISFYEKIGASRVHTFEVHRGVSSYIYRYELPNYQ